MAVRQKLSPNQERKLPQLSLRSHNLALTVL